jgi:hypothetical protein
MRNLGAPHSTVIAKSGHLSSHKLHLMQSSGRATLTFPPSISRQFFGQKATQISQPLHHLRLTLIIARFFSAAWLSATPTTSDQAYPTLQKRYYHHSKNTVRNWKQYIPGRVTLQAFLNAIANFIQDSENGAGARNRTADLRITSALLYQLSYASPHKQISI